MNNDIDRYIGIYTVINKFLNTKSTITVKKDIRDHVELVGKLPDSTRQITLFIVYTENKSKTSKVFGKNLEWGMSRKDEQIQGNNIFYCFIHFDRINGTYKYFIVPNEKVIKYLKYEHDYWLKAETYHKTSSFRYFRLGLFYKVFNPDVLMAYDYQDKWDLIK